MSPPESESGSADFLDLHDLNQSYPLIMACLMFGIQPDLLAVSAGRFEVFKVPLLVSFPFPLLLLDEIREILQDGTEVGAVTRIPCTPEKVHNFSRNWKPSPLLRIIGSHSTVLTVREKFLPGHQQPCQPVSPTPEPERVHVRFSPERRVEGLGHQAEGGVIPEIAGQGTPLGARYRPGKDN